MDILWHGRTSFTIKGKSATVILDPHDGTGFPKAKLRGQVVISSLKSSDAKMLEVDGSEKVFDAPGEYECGGVPMHGIQTWEAGGKKSDEKKKITAFVFEVDGIKICHLGALEETLSENVIEAIGNVDILLIPVGGKQTLDAKKAHGLVEEIEPRIVIPMFHKVDGEKLEIASVDPFLKEVGSKAQPVEKFSVDSKSKLPQDHEEYVVLMPVG
ncbi:MAG: MBL fold metallo-hydrolase [Patescibacteria group bacterium]